MPFDPIYDDAKKANTINLGPKCKSTSVIGTHQTHRMIDLILEPDKELVSIIEKGHEVLHETDGGRQKISCWLYEYPNGAKSRSVIRLARTTSKGYVYGGQEISFYGEAFKNFMTFVQKMKLIDTSERKPFSLSYAEFQKMVDKDSDFYNMLSSLSKNDLEKLLANIPNIDDLAKISGIKQKETALRRFREIIDGDYEHEKDIEKFLKQNIWIFGNEFSVFIDDTKVNESNILDLFPKNYDGFVDIIELKLPKEKLFNYDSSHNNYYPTAELTKVISQLQNYLFELEKKTSDDGYQNKNGCVVVKPKGIIVFGSQQQLTDDELKYLRILNSSYHNITIYTYQQIYEMASSILERICKRDIQP